MREINKGSFYFYFLKNEIKRDHIQMVFLHYWKTPTVTLLLNAKSLQINQREYQEKYTRFNTQLRLLKFLDYILAIDFIALSSTFSTMQSICTISLTSV